MSKQVVQLELVLPDHARVYDVSALIHAWDAVLRQYLPDATLKARMPMPPPPKPHPTVM